MLGLIHMDKKADKPVVAGVDDLIEGLSSNNFRVAEASFDELRRQIGAIKRNIHRAAIREKDSNALSLMVELLGESKDPRYLPFIARQLESKNPRVRLFAHAALFRLGTPESRDLHRRCDLRDLLSGAL